MPVPMMPLMTIIVASKRPSLAANPGVFCRASFATTVSSGLADLLGRGRTVSRNGAGRRCPRAFEAPRGAIQRTQSSHPVILAEPGAGDRAFEHAGGLIVDLERHWEGMPVLAAVSEGESRRLV